MFLYGARGTCLKFTSKDSPEDIMAQSSFHEQRTSYAANHPLKISHLLLFLLQRVRSIASSQRSNRPSDQDYKRAMAHRRTRFGGNYPPHLPRLGRRRGSQGSLAIPLRGLTGGGKAAAMIADGTKRWIRKRVLGEIEIVRHGPESLPCTAGALLVPIRCVPGRREKRCARQPEPAHAKKHNLGCVSLKGSC
jgi:hypothetical protein